MSRATTAKLAASAVAASLLLAACSGNSPGHGSKAKGRVTGSSASQSPSSNPSGHPHEPTPVAQTDMASLNIPASVRSVLDGTSATLVNMPSGVYMAIDGPFYGPDLSGTLDVARVTEATQPGEVDGDFGAVPAVDTDLITTPVDFSDGPGFAAPIASGVSPERAVSGVMRAVYAKENPYCHLANAPLPPNSQLTAVAAEVLPCGPNDALVVDEVVAFRGNNGRVWIVANSQGPTTPVTNAIMFSTFRVAD